LLGEQLKTKRSALMAYLTAKDFPLTGSVAVVDIGWRGTIQDNLAYVLPSVRIDGFYLGLEKYLNPQPSNVRKFAFGPDINTESPQHADVFAKVDPIKMLCNSPHGSVVGYSVTEGATVNAQRLVSEAENAVYYDFVLYFQKGVIMAAENVGNIVRSHVVPVE